MLRVAAAIETGTRQTITFLFTHDLAAGERFYGELLGLPLVYTRDKVRIYAASRHCFIGLSALPGRVPHPEGMTFALVVDDVPGWYDRLTHAGVVADHPPQHNAEHAIDIFTVRDPSGYRIEILSMRDPEWPQPIRPNAR